MIQPREEKLLGNTYLLISYCVLGLGVEGVSLFSDLERDMKHTMNIEGAWK